MRTIHAAPLALGLLLAQSAHAATVVDCGRLLDVKSGKWRDNVSVVVDQGKVVAVEPAAAGADHLDLRGYSCLPGLIDAHVHLTLQF
ncbi:MAG TPA: hypothetical protein VFA75_20690, partial [Nevskia sp.]|nr:hypothetical protein [Nevskia sp.]